MPNSLKIYCPISKILTEAKKTVKHNINFTMVLAYWNIGRIIFEEEQNSEQRAEYGKYLILELSEKLTLEFGKGFDTTNLKRMRQFYIGFSKGAAVRHLLIDKKKSTKLTAQNNNKILENSLETKFLRPQLSWTHYKNIIKVKDEKARFWYMNEAADNGWSTRVLDRQINSLYYERLLKSKDKDLLKQETLKSINETMPENLLKDPYVLEFLDLPDKNIYRESDLENELIDKLNEFILELGKGFSFVSRQKRIITDDEDYYIDLVFYNYILKCFVLIDLKIGKLTHQDIGQMDMYIRLYEDKYKIEGDNPTIGLILCSHKNETVVKYSVLNESKQLFASKYQLYLPTEEELKQELNNEIKFIKEQKILYSTRL